MMESDAPLFSAHDLGKAYPGPPRVEALSGVSLTVRAGEMLAVRGPSGSGKSTLLNLLGLLDSPTSGNYEVGGRDTSLLTDRQRDRLRAEVFGFVFQASHLISHRSATSNVELALQMRGVPYSQRRARAERAISEVGLEHRATSAARALSGGERQRVALARAIVGHPRVLLADEPTGNLDEGATRTVIQLLRECASRGLGVVVITHDSRVSGAADRTALLCEGKLQVA